MQNAEQLRLRRQAALKELVASLMQNAVKLQVDASTITGNEPWVRDLKSKYEKNFGVIFSPDEIKRSIMLSNTP